MPSGSFIPASGLHLLGLLPKCLREGCRPSHRPLPAQPGCRQKAFGCGVDKHVRDGSTQAITRRPGSNFQMELGGRSMTRKIGVPSCASNWKNWSTPPRCGRRQQDVYAAILWTRSDSFGSPTSETRIPPTPSANRSSKNRPTIGPPRTIDRSTVSAVRNGFTKLVVAINRAHRSIIRSSERWQAASSPSLAGKPFSRVARSRWKKMLWSGRSLAIVPVSRCSPRVLRDWEIPCCGTGPRRPSRSPAELFDILPCGERLDVDDLQKVLYLRRQRPRNRSIAPHRSRRSP